MMFPFEIPMPEGCFDTPKWNGQHFVMDDLKTTVIEYSENFAGWSDDLTTLHEEAVGDSHPIDRASRQDAIAQVLKCTPTDQAVIMEIGCSSGYFIQELVKTFPKHLILGADVVKEPLYQLANHLPGVPLFRFDLLKCPLPDNSIDVLVMLNVLEHIADDEGALHKAYHLLKPGGFLIVEVPAGPKLYDGYDAALCHFRRYTALELNAKLHKAGFTIRRQSHLGFLLFPAFAAVKLLNKMRGKRNNKTVVQSQASSTSGSWLVKWAMEAENKWLSGFQLPIGIRVLMTAQRKA